MSPAAIRRPRPHRRFPRLTLRVDVELETTAYRTKAVATTLGAGGLFVATDEPWFPGTPLSVRLRLPGQEAWLALEARVAWTHEPGEHPTAPGMGLEFVDATSRVELAERLERWAADREASGADQR